MRAKKDMEENLKNIHNQLLNPKVYSESQAHEEAK